MYRGDGVKWTTAQARENFSRLLREAKNEPQEVFNRDHFVAAVVDEETYRAFRAWRESRASLQKAFAGVRQILQEEAYTLEVPDRRNRADPLLE
jgi:hypothetical protein